MFFAFLISRLRRAALQFVVHGPRVNLRFVLLTMLLDCTCVHASRLPALLLHHREGIAVAPIPAELASTHFTVTLNRRATPVVHAAASYYLLSFPMHAPVDITVTADEDGFWSRGVEVQPWRFGIRPKIMGRTISFRLDRPAKLSITRPNDYLGSAQMLFLFADPVEHNAPRGPTAGLRYFGPGMHRENIDAHDGDRIYLAPGAVILGSLNVWQVHDVHVSGRGTIVYDGPQNPADDDGWMHKRNWHCIVMDNARAITIDGLTCIVRSRTWMIQMKDSRDIHYTNIKVIGGSPGNANQDGMDWLGGGDTTVDDSFFRAADDIFAMQGNWEGYGTAAFAIPGHDVTNIAITRSTLSTSISNVVRAAWPEKSFNSSNFSLTDSDVMHMGLGGCKVPFALLEVWADPDGTGQHSRYRLSDIRLEDWYSLLQLRQPAPGIDHVTLSDIFALDQPSLVASALSGSVHDTVLRNINIADRTITDARQLPLDVLGGAKAAVVAPATLAAGFTVAPGPHRPHDRVHFTSNAPAIGQPAIRHYDWSFGDGGFAHGASPHHRFPDAAGTLRDGSGRFRVILHTTDEAGHESWSARPVVVAAQFAPPVPAAAAREPGLSAGSAPSDAPTLDSDDVASHVSGISPTLTPDSRPRPENYHMDFDGLVQIPTDGGYTFTLLGNDAARLEIDGRIVAISPAPWPQVCGSRGNAVRPATGSLGLQAGLHRIHAVMTHTLGEDGFAVLWQGDGLPLAPIPASALSHVPAASRTPATP